MQDAAHELRNPLAAMKSILQQSQAQKIDDKRLAANLASLERQTDHLTNITTDLLLLERTESKPVKPIDIVPLLHDVTEGLHYKSQRKGVKVTVSAPDTLNAVISPSHFVAISKNLIDNAIKFSPSGKKAAVTVKLVKHSGGWKLTVKDKGVGIKKSEHKHLTQRFYRASNSVEIEGTGLGLAIVSKYVSLYEGTLQIVSSPGKGTTVTITC
jgi:signal transduction histidine kinase